jgi:NADH:ubiquinone oxidoreductase subunit 6 (subunit J)
MSKRTILGGVAAVALLAVLFAGIAATDIQTDYDEPNGVLTGMGAGSGEGMDGADSIIGADGKLKENSLEYSIFEKYGVVLIPLAILMFGAMVGGVCIAREEVEEDGSN